MTMMLIPRCRATFPALWSLGMMGAPQPQTGQQGSGEAMIKNHLNVAVRNLLLSWTSSLATEGLVVRQNEVQRNCFSRQKQKGSGTWAELLPAPFADSFCHGHDGQDRRISKRAGEQR